MRTKNFPARRLARQLRAARDDAYAPWTEDEVKLLTKARAIRSKKSRRARNV